MHDTLISEIELGIWKELNQPFFALAPMEDVTDTVFRQIVLSISKPDILFTEFTSCEGLLATAGTDKVAHRLRFTQGEHPLIAQIWGKSPESYLYGAKKIFEMGFDGVDINMGCPVKKIIKQGCCSALINNEALASEIILATKEGAGTLPVSVKTRIGFDKVVTDRWIPFLLEHDLAAITVHGRTTAQLSKVPADWDQINLARQLRDRSGKTTLIVGNGDILTLKQGEKLSEKYHLDGVMIGRGIFQNPWIFDPTTYPDEISKEMRIKLLRKHLDLYYKTWGDSKNFAIMKKFFKMYIRDFDGASELRNEMMQINGYDEIVNYLDRLKEDEL